MASSAISQVILVILCSRRAILGSIKDSNTGTIEIGPGNT